MMGACTVQAWFEYSNVPKSRSKILHQTLILRLCLQMCVEEYENGIREVRTFENRISNDFDMFSVEQILVFWMQHKFPLYAVYIGTL